MSRHRHCGVAGLLFFLLATALSTSQSLETRAHREAEMQRYAKLAARESHVLASGADYDVVHYRLELTMPTADPQFRGAVTMKANSTIDGLGTVVLNAGSALVIDSVLDGARNIMTFAHEGDSLKVTVGNLARGAAFELRIVYHTPFQDSPVARGLVNHAVFGGQTLAIGSQSEPYDARHWWPCKDDPADKADSVEVVVTVDSSLFCVSNGLLRADTRHSNGTRTFHWVSKYPIATYLVMIAAARYATYETTFTHAGITMPVTNWYYGLTAAQMAQSETAMLDGLRVYSDLFGTYPFIREKYGMAEYEAFGGAMEHQTVSSMGFYGTDVTVHELFHQWFGDKVTCATFEHIWLNEGWATYGEALYAESRWGLAGLKDIMSSNTFYGPGTIYVYNALDKGMNQIFNGNLSYNKASWVVHMLRHVVGDSVFFRATRKYLGGEERTAYRSVTTDEFRGYYERESGMDLRPFFQQWIMGEYFPTYKVSWTSVPSGSDTQVDLRIEQLYTPQRQVFDMPIDITFQLAGRDTTVVIRNNTALATYTFVLPEKPRTVQLDKDNWILKQVVTPIANPTFDKGILLVNGVDWDVEAYTTEIKNAYADSIFTGNKPYTFWDLFPDPDAGYPANMPAPAGSGAVPAELIGNYCTVVWIGNAYGGDEAVWNNSNIWEYIKAGGNVILVTRMGRSFISTDLQQFLGLTWVQSNRPLAELKTKQTWLANMRVVGDQSLVHPFQSVLTRPENELLYVDTQANPATELGQGVLAKPQTIAGAPTGYMAFLSMRPYRVVPEDMKPTMQALLDRLPCIPRSTGVTEPLAPDAPEIVSTFPNPIHAAHTSLITINYRTGATTARYTTLRLYDALGREVRTLENGEVGPGLHAAVVDASTLPTGVYICTIESGGIEVARTLHVLR